MNSDSTKAMLSKVSMFVFGGFRKTQFIVFSIGAAFLYILELVSYFASKSDSLNVAACIASRLWMLGYLAFVISFIGIVIVQIKEDSKNKTYLIPAVFLAILLFFIFQIGNYSFSDLSYEATQETVSGLDAFKTADWNYTGLGFTGYPIKQYLIYALPTLVLGRNFFALNLGFAIPFLTGLTLLFIELRKFLRFKGLDEKFALLPILMISFFPYIDEFYYIFEQTITPVSFSMIIIALFLRVIRRPSLFSFTLFAFNACMLPFLYTPTLAFMGLVLVIGLYHALMVFKGKSLFSKRRKNDLFYIIAVSISSVLPSLFFICTLICKREDDFMTPLSDRTPIDTLKNYYHSLASFYIDSSSVFFGVFGAIVLIYLLASITMRLKFHNLIIALWCLATAVFSFMLPGASHQFGFNYDPLILAQRCMLIIPVVAVACMLTAADYLIKHDISLRKDALAIVSLACLLFGVNSLFTTHRGCTFNNYIQSMKYITQYCQEVTRYHGIKYDDEFCLVIHSDNTLYTNPMDYTRYFFPNAKVYRFPVNDAGGIGVNDAIFPRFVISDSETVEDYYQLDFKSRDFKSSRFNTIYTLYFVYIEPDYSYTSFYDQEYIEKYNLQAYVTESTAPSEG